MFTLSQLHFESTHTSHTQNLASQNCKQFDAHITQKNQYFKTSCKAV